MQLIARQLFLDRGRAITNLSTRQTALAFAVRAAWVLILLWTTLVAMRYDFSSIPSVWGWLVIAYAAAVLALTMGRDLAWRRWGRRASSSPHPDGVAKYVKCDLLGHDPRLAEPMTVRQRATQIVFALAFGATIIALAFTGYTMVVILLVGGICTLGLLVDYNRLFGLPRPPGPAANLKPAPDPARHRAEL